MTTPSPDDRDRPHSGWKLPPEPPIHRAARKGDIAELQRLIKDGADIDERADLEFDNGAHLRGLTPLMDAARSIDGASTETLKWLVKQGADLHAESAGGDTAAWYAAGHGGRWEFHKRAVTPDHVHRLRYLLDAGLDVGECNSGRSLLTEAAEAGDPARVSLLLEGGVDATPLESIADTSNRVTRFCKTLGSLLHLSSNRGSGPLRGERDSFQLPIFCASQSGSADCVRLLLDACANPNERDKEGQTPLMVAGSVAVVEALINAGADLNAVDEFGSDAFEAVIEESCGSGVCGAARFDVADAIISAGVDIERVDRYGKTRLASAAFGHHDDAVSFLLKHGANVHARQSGGDTPLHSICWQGEYKDPAVNKACERIIETLVRAGVDPNTTNHQGTTPMHEAPDGDWGNPTAIRTLLRLGAQADPVDEDGNTPLILGSGKGEDKCIRLLLEAGADPQKKNNAGETARDAAQEHLSTWESIVAKGADAVDAALMEAKEAVACEMAELVGDTSSLPDLDIEQERSTRNQEALADARSALELIENAIGRKKSSVD